MALLVVASCGPLLGLDELRDRVEEAPADASTADAPAIPDSSTPPECTTHAQCIDAANGAPALCAAGQCVAVAKHEGKSLCLPQVLPSNDVLRDESVALFAAFIPIRGSAPLSSAYGLAYSLALKELQAAGGIPGTPRRHVAMVFCASEPDLAKDAVQHVTQRLRLPAMIGSFSDSDMTTFVQDYAIPNGVFTLNPNAATETLKYLDVKRLVWSLLGPPEDVALAYRPLVARTEPYAKARDGRDPGLPLKLAMLVTDTSTELSIETVLRQGALVRTGAGSTRDAMKAIVFNGMTADANGERFLRIKVDALEEGATPRYGEIRASLDAFRPDVVIALTGEEIARIASEHEADVFASPGDGGTAVPPVWLLAPRNARDTSLLEYLSSPAHGGFSLKRKRFLGVQYAGAVDGDQRTKWLSRMKDEYPAVPESTYAAVENFYDAVYWLAYGLAAAGPGAPVTGESLRDGVRNLLSGPNAFPGPPAEIAAAMLAISVGDVRFVGALGPPDIDTQFGTWNSVGGVYCYPNGPSAAPKYDVLRYNRATGALDGTFDCFLDPPF